MYVKIIEDKNGDYVNTDGERFYVLCADWARTQTWEEAESKEAAAAAYGLTFSPLPEEESFS